MKITVQLPGFVQYVEALEATRRGVVPLAPCAVADAKAALKLDAIESGRGFVLRRKQGLAQ